MALDIFDEEFDEAVLQHVIQNEKLINEHGVLNEISTNKMEAKESVKISPCKLLSTKLCNEKISISEGDFEKMLVDSEFNLNDSKINKQCTSPILTRKKSKLRKKRPMRFKENLLFSEKKLKISQKNCSKDDDLNNSALKENINPMGNFEDNTVTNSNSKKSCTNNQYIIDKFKENISKKPSTIIQTRSPSAINSPLSTTKLKTNNFVPKVMKSDHPTQQCNGFKTASHKPLKISAEAWKKAKDLITENDALISFEISQNVEMKDTSASKTTEQKNFKDSKQIDKYNYNPKKRNGFSTASNKPLTISAKAWKRAQNLITENNALIDIEMTQTVNPDIVTNDKSSNLKTDIILPLKINAPEPTALDEHSQAANNINKLPKNTNNCDLKPAECSGFATASNKPLKISAKAWKKAQDLITENNAMLSLELSLNPENANAPQLPEEKLKDKKLISESLTNNCVKITENQPNICTPYSKEKETLINNKKSSLKESPKRPLYFNNNRAKRRNSSYRPPRKSLQDIPTTPAKSEAPVEDRKSVKNNSHKIQLGMRPEAENQINISDESMLQALALFEGI